MTWRRRAVTVRDLDRGRPGIQFTRVGAVPAVTSHAVTVTVADAGDAVSGATVTVAGHAKKANGKGVAKIVAPGAGTTKVTVTVACAGYAELTSVVKL
jgi:hypothetical protein